MGWSLCISYSFYASCPITQRSGLQLATSILPFFHSGATILRHAYGVSVYDDLVFFVLRLSFVVSSWVGFLSVHRHSLIHIMKIPITPLATQPVSLQEADRTNVIKVATWTLLGITVTVFVARQIMKAIVFRRVALDDLFILLATVSV